MAESEGEIVNLQICHLKDSEISDGEKYMDREGGDDKGNGDARENIRHSFVPLLFFFFHL